MTKSREEQDRNETYNEAVPAKARTMLEIAVIASALERGKRANEKPGFCEKRRSGNSQSRLSPDNNSLVPRSFLRSQTRSSSDAGSDSDRQDCRQDRDQSDPTNPFNTSESSERGEGVDGDGHAGDKDGSASTVE